MISNPKLPDFPQDMDGRIVIERLDENDNVIERTFGTSEKERFDAHNEYNCDAFCGYCYKEACEWLAKQEDEKQQTDYKNSLKNDY